MDGIEIASDGGEEDVVESGDAHRVLGPGGRRMANLRELYCVWEGFGNVKGTAKRVLKWLPHCG